VAFVNDAGNDAALAFEDSHPVYLNYMALITIPKKVTKGTDLVVIPLEEYEWLLAERTVSEFMPTAAERRDLARARKNRARGNYLTLDALRHKLGFTG
jgi:PHD/YefM family antitoxin component YafN of YafNO toxin-antitoxin module